MSYTEAELEALHKIIELTIGEPGHKVADALTGHVHGAECPMWNGQYTHSPAHCPKA
jgi:hypothetical protein